MNQKLQEVITLIEHYGACAALAAGGALIVTFAQKLFLGPIIPQIIGALLVAVAGFLAGCIGIEFVQEHQNDGKIGLLLAVLLSGFLCLAGTYFVVAAVHAAMA